MTRTVSVHPIGKGGGCSQSAIDEMGMSSLCHNEALEKPGSGLEQGHSDLLAIYTAEDNHEAMFSALLQESHFTITYFESTLRCVALSDDHIFSRLQAAIRFIKRCFYRLFLSVTMSGKYVPREVADRCRTTISFMLLKLPLLTDHNKQSLLHIQSGLYWLSHSSLISNIELMQGLEAAYEVLTNRRLELSRGLPLTHHFFARGDFFLSLAVEIVFHRCRNNEYSDLPYICAVLKAVLLRNDLFACYLVYEIAEYMREIEGWVPDYEVLFEGKRQVDALKQCLETDFEELRSVTKTVLKEMELNKVSELREIARKLAENSG